ncbi:hypothetical protein AcW1_001393 [Taiwanofungus camphoratus]|nr:hypothetical protein AcW2_000076 [Antrodia cinnamomea]KAI0937404.1 hypothetical protein AcV5_005320 [Antrodia cinnamomea]KAI0962614.1 hypothetical protein AcV7_001417 [Antrodia cinnamomea]KAI0964616.1 hypothetical protein AcW1_001393 [Antrodia cinnamomea]
MASALNVTYKLYPPVDTPVANISPTKTHEFPLKTQAQTGKEYYVALRAAIEQAKTTLGEELTVWRDAVGNREQLKEGKKSGREEGEEEEEEEEGE